MLALIRTAEQILADIAAAGGDVWPPDHTDEQRWEAYRASAPIRKAQVVAGDVTIEAPASGDWVKHCKADGCRNESPRYVYCSSHRRRLRKHGDLMLDKPLRCSCGQCPVTVRQRRQKMKVELVGDVWLSPVV